MTVKMDNVGIVVDDLEPVIGFFTELGLELVGRGTVDGEWSGRVTGLPGQRVEIAMMQTPDGHSRLELSRFLHRPSSPTTAERRSTLSATCVSCSASTTSTTRSTDCVRTTSNSSATTWCASRTRTGSLTCAAPKASSSDWPRT